MPVRGTAALRRALRRSRAKPTVDRRGIVVDDIVDAPSSEFDRQGGRSPPRHRFAGTTTTRRPLPMSGTRASRICSISAASNMPVSGP